MTHPPTAQGAHPVNLLYPELWLLLTEEAAAAAVQAEIGQRLADLAATVPLAAWRQHHRRVLAITPSALAVELRQALGAGCPAVHVHACWSEDDLESAVEAADLPAGAERALHLHGWGQPLAAWWPMLAAELSGPDAWVEVGWRLSRGSSIPPLSLPGEPASAQGYREAFKAWRAECFKLGDSGLPPFAGEDDDEADLAELASGSTMPGPASSPRLDFPDMVPLPSQVWRLPPPPRPVTGRRLGYGAMGASAAAGSASGTATWFDIVVLEGVVPAPGSGIHWPYKLHIQRLSQMEDGAWLSLRARLVWAEDVAAEARRHDHRVCLLPRLQRPQVFTIGALSGAFTFKPAMAPTSDARAWQDALPGTLATVVPLPLP